MRQVPPIADKVAEPMVKGGTDLLQALPPEEASFYAHENHVVDWRGRNLSMFHEIQEHFGFIGGSKT